MSCCLSCCLSCSVVTCGGLSYRGAGYVRCCCLMVPLPLRRVLPLHGGDNTQEWNKSYAAALQFDPVKGMHLECALQVWSDYESDFVAIMQLRKLEFMFSW